MSGFNEVVVLVKYGDPTISNTGITSHTESRYECFAKMLSVGSKEFYEASSTGMKPEMKFVLPDYTEYQGETILEHEGIRYKVLRTYRTGNQLEITVTGEVSTLSMPKSVVKFDKNGVRFESSVDKVKYLINELERAALRDVGKFICRTFRKSYYNTFRRRSGKVGKYTQYWVRSKQPVPNLQVGLKPNAFYGGFEEVGSSKQPKLGLLSSAVSGNVSMIIQIESQYLSALESEAAALAKINESDYEGGAEDA